MKIAQKRTLHVVVVVFANGMTRTVKVKAVKRETAEQKALKFNPSATGVKRGA